MEDILLGWMIGVVIYLLFLAHDTYRMCYAPVRTEVKRERSRHEA